MGWDFCAASKDELVAELTRDEVSSYTGAKRVCLAYAVTTGREKTLWTVWEVTPKDKPVHRYIGCDLLDSQKIEGRLFWGYKGMAEVEHPYYYDCPVAFLVMVSVASAEWRAGVAAFWAAHPKAKAKLVFKTNEAILPAGPQATFAF
jgi:hypothetical protein